MINIIYIGLIWLTLNTAAIAATLEAISGEVSIRSGEQVPEKIMVAQLPRELLGGQRVETAANARAKLKFDGGVEITLSSNSQLQLPDLTKENKGLLQIVMGKARVLVKSLIKDRNPAFEIHTRDAIMGIRETEFIIRSRT